MQQLASAEAIFKELHTDQGLHEAEKLVHASGQFAEHLRAFLRELRTKGPADAAQSVRLGVAHGLLENWKDAANHLDGATLTAGLLVLRARVYRQLQRYEPAIADLRAAAKSGGNDFDIALELATTLRLAGKLDAAQAELDRIRKGHEKDPDVLCEQAALAEALGSTEQAIDILEQALAVDPNHQACNFRLAYILDLHGEEDRAIGLYERVIDSPPIHVNALLNLAVLYEDRDRYEDALRCLQQVLIAHPNHPRAILFAKDVEAGFNMEYDEEAERNRGKREAILKTPISDFELTIRSRNCLKKLNVNTLGDLLRISEAQLRQYKNFGETSLEEVQAVLSARGLRLGQLLEEQQMPRRPLAALRRTQQTALSTGQDPNETLLKKPVVELELSVRSRKCLQRLNVTSVGELIQKSEAELLSTKNFGATSLTEIKGRLAELGLSLRGNR